MSIDLELYRIFCEVAKTGNITKAAHNLFVSQSAVSQSIKLLENRLKGKLFDRSVHGVTLTAEGKVLYSHIRDSIRIIENAQVVVSDMIDLSSGSVRIGASDTICSLYLLPALKKFNQLYPDIQLSVTNRTTSESIKLLKNASVDIAFVNLPITDEDSFEVIKVKTIHDCFVVGEKYFHLAETKLNFNHLSNYPLLSLEQESNSRTQMDLFMQKHNYILNPSIELGSLSLLREFAKIGLGIALTVREDVTQMLKANELKELSFFHPLPTRHFGLLIPKNISLSFAAKAFIQQIEVTSII